MVGFDAGSTITDSEIYAKTLLPNGVRVISEFVPEVRSVSIGLWVGVGSSHEDAPLRGISHCIEHMLFKGTRARSARQLAEQMDSIGGHMNAFTDKETTCYHARVVDMHAPLALDILADMFTNSIFDPAELRKEQQVILEEIRMYDDSPDEVSHDLFIRSVWAGSPLGEPTIGYADTVTAVTRDSIAAYMREKYTPDNLIVAAAGSVDHNVLVEQVSRHFSGMQGGPTAGEPAAPTFVPAITVQRKDSEQVYVLVGAEGVSARDERRYAVSVLDTILGGGMASRLFQEIREKRGLAYSVYSAHHAYRAGGLCSIAAATSPPNVSEVVSLVRAELLRLAAEDASSEEIGRAKEHLKGGLLLSLESMSTRMLRLGRSELNLGRHVPVSEVIARIDAVSKEQVDSVARTLFVPERIALTVLGPVDEQIEAALTGAPLAEPA